MRAFERLDGLDCFDAESSAFVKRSAVVSWTASDGEMAWRISGEVDGGGAVVVVGGGGEGKVEMEGGRHGSD